VSIEGNPLHPISKGGLCAKGKAGLQVLYHPARLTAALERDSSGDSSGFAPVSWDEALERIAERLRSLRDAGRPGSVAWLGGEISGSMREVVECFLGAYGTPHVIRDDYADGSEQIMRLTQGIEARPAFDLERADLVLSFGAPLSEAWWCLPQAARARVRTTEPARWIQIDTRLSRTATAADEWLPIRPGSYGTLAMSIAYVLLKEGLYDHAFVERHVAGFEDRRDQEGRRVHGFRSLVLRHGRPDDVAGRIGIPAEEIVKLAKQFGRSRRPLAVWDHVVGWSCGGLSHGLAIHALNVLVGSVQRPGGISIQRPLPVSLLGDAPSIDASSGHPGTILDNADWPQRVLESDPGIEVLFVHRSNPVASRPDPDLVRQALEKVSLVVSFSPFLDETAQHADLVLPDHTYLERWEDAPAPSSVPDQVWGVVQPVVPPLHDTRATGDFLIDLASRVGGRVADACPWGSMERLVRARGEALAAAHRGSVFESAFRREELRELERRGWWIPHGRGVGSFWERLRESGGWFDPNHDDRGLASVSRRPDGRVALFSEEARRTIVAGMPGLVEGFLPLEDDDETLEGEYPLRMIPYRVMTLASGTTALTPWLLENIGPLTESAWESWIEIHPGTGRELGLASGQRVRVRSLQGQFIARVRLFAGAQPDVVNAPYGLHSAVNGWGPMECANPLSAVGNRRDPITNLPDWYSTRVEIESV
jgi:anaerobic selenocysteine-containing dehydrogenase